MAKAKQQRAPARPKAKAKPAKAKAKPEPKPKPKAKPAAKPKSKPAAKPKAKPIARTRRAKPAARPSPGGAVVRILDAERPLDALRDFLASIAGMASMQEGQIALGAAQLILLPIAREHRGGPEVHELLDLVLSRWMSFPDKSGFHAQEFLRNAFAAVGNDRERIGELVKLVPVDASPELRFNVASALAVAGDRDAMLRAVEGALATGVSPAAFQRDKDFSEYTHDPAMQELLAKAGAPTIPVDVRPHTPRIRAALDSLVRTLRELGEKPSLGPPATLDTVLEAERAGQIQLPNDYRALLTVSDGPAVWSYQFFGTADFRSETALVKSAREYIASSLRFGDRGLDDCVPLAACGQPTDWLFYDPYGRTRGGAPGYVLVLGADPRPLDDLSDVLARLEDIVRDVLGTN
jgi:hypothetical protein